MKKTTMLAVLAGGLTATAALAQPAFTDLGTLTPGTPTNVSVPGVAANSVVWYRFTLPTAVRYQDLRALDIWSFNSSGSSQDTEISVWDSAGNFIVSDDDDGNSLSSALSFGTGSGGFPQGTTTLTANNGRDGDLIAAGDYYIGISFFNVVWGTTNWTVTTAGTTALTAFDVRLNLANITPVDPVGTVDLGTLGASATINSTGNALGASQVRWFKVNLPGADRAGPALGTFIDIDTEGSLLSPSNTTRIVMYSPSGTLLSNSVSSFQDATDGSGSLSQLTFGEDIPARPAVGTGLPYNGRDGATLRPGLYYIGIGGVGTSPSISSTVTGANFGFTSTSTNSGTVNLNINNVLPSVGPSATGTSVITSTCVNTLTGGTADIRVTVIPGANPTAAITSVVADASSLGLSSSLTLLDDGNSGDLLAGDGVYGAQVTIAPGLAVGAASVPFVVTDALSRSANGSLSVSVIAGTSAATGVESIAGAIVPPGTPGSPLASIAGTFVLNQAAVYQIQICDEAAFSATTLGGTTADTQMFLFNADGTGVVMNDDHVTPTTGFQSTITSNFVTANGTYYLAVTQYDRDPVTNVCGTGTIWSDTPFRAERAPDGTTPGVAFLGWSGTATLPATTAYTIALTGACVPGTPAPTCDSVDFNNDGVFPDDQDLADFIFVLGGGSCATCNDVDFNNDGVFPDDSDLEIFLFVLGGGSC